VLASFLAATALSLPAAYEVRLASPGLRQSDLAPDAVAADMTRLATALGEAGVHVLTRDELSATLSADQQADLLACVLDVSNCNGALANALGADGVLTGSIKKGEGGFQLELEVVSARDGSTLGAWSSRVAGESGLLDEMNAAAKKLGAELVRKLAPGMPSDAPVDVAKASPDGGVPLTPKAAEANVASAPSKGQILASRITMVSGAAVAGIGAVFVVLAKTEFDDLDTAKTTDANGNQSLSAARAVASHGASYQTAGVVVLSVGCTALLTGAVIYFASGGKTEQSNLLPGVSPHQLLQRPLQWDFF
jgi:hypothetical protein